MLGERGGYHPPPTTYDLRRPSTGTRVLLFLLSIAASSLLFSVGFPPGAPDRLPILLIAVTLALGSAYRPERTLAIFAFLFPCSGLLARLCGGTDPTTWPALLFGGLAAGWTFRFIYDFESVPQPSRSDRTLRALVLLWVIATGLAVFRAATLWAVLRGLSGRAVNGEGLPDAEAIRESLFSLSALAAGAAFYFLLRRCPAAVRASALRSALLGIMASALAGGLQRVGLLPGETRAYWRLTRQVSGGAADPNALGLLCGLALLIALSDAMRSRQRSRFDLVLAVSSAVGLLLSGSRSGLLLMVLGLPLLIFAGRLPSRIRATALAVLAGGTVLLALFLLRASPGTLGSRLAQTFDSSLPVEYRVSARPLLWRAAGRLFLRHPVEGAGMGAFSWRFPDLIGEENRRLAMRDNPGSAALQALAETGIAGFLLTALFALGLFVQAIARARAPDADSLAAGSAVSVAAFLAALAVGSHWFAPEVSLFFFLLAALAASPESLEDSSATDRPLWRRVPAAIAVLYLVAAGIAILSTNRAEKAFRFSPRIGFHAPESLPGGPVRWTRRRFGLLLEPGRNLRLALRNDAPDRMPVVMEARVDDHPALRSALEPGEIVTLGLSAAKAPRAFVFSLSRSFVPKRLGLSGDRRELGVLSAER